MYADRTAVRNLQATVLLYARLCWSPTVDPLLAVFCRASLDRFIKVVTYSTLLYSIEKRAINWSQPCFCFDELSNPTPQPDICDYLYLWRWFSASNPAFSPVPPPSTFLLPVHLTNFAPQASPANIVFYSRNLFVGGKLETGCEEVGGGPGRRGWGQWNYIRMKWKYGGNELLIYPYM